MYRVLMDLFWFSSLMVQNWLKKWNAQYMYEITRYIFCVLCEHWMENFKTIHWKTCFTYFITYALGLASISKIYIKNLFWQYVKSSWYCSLNWKLHDPYYIPLKVQSNLELRNCQIRNKLGLRNFLLITNPFIP